ncbi:histone acetyltransferase p300-like isoform X2 [Cloeon dipterum]|uniref:histone acetyltransferase p300-like isoform X2 n=1 Tax=Cloeon dipterum TaxID=197152 RepID=UPI00321F9045
MGRNKNEKKNKNESGKPKPQQQKEQEKRKVKSHGIVEDCVVANRSSCEEFLKAAPTAEQQKKPPLISETNVVDPDDVTISQQMGKSKSKKKKGKQQPQQQKQEAEVGAATEPQKTRHEKVESRRVVANAVRNMDTLQNAAAAAAEPKEQNELSPIYAINLVNPLDIKFCQSSEEDSHSGESQMPKSGGEDFSVSQLNLHVLMHALMCRAFNTKIAVPAQCVPGCRETKILLMHMAQCEAKKNKHCNYSEYCLAYRALLGHWILCDFSDCKICSFIYNKRRDDRTKTVKQEAKTSVQPQSADLASGDTECIEAGFTVTYIEDTDLRRHKLIPKARNGTPKMKRRMETEV